VPGFPYDVAADRKHFLTIQENQKQQPHS